MFERISGKSKSISRKGAKEHRRKENKEIVLCRLCDLASVREIVYLFTFGGEGENVAGELPAKDVKNEDRSGKVYENKGTDDN